MSIITLKNSNEAQYKHTEQWYKVRFNMFATINGNRVRTWLNYNCNGDAVIGAGIIRFEQFEDAFLFALTVGAHINE